MSQSWPKPGVNHVGEYQVSGHMMPIEGSSDTVYLKFVASSITFTESGGTFTVFDNQHTGSATVTISAPCRIKGKFLTFKTTKDAVVELTNIPSGSYMPPIFSVLTGS